MINFQNKIFIIFAITISLGIMAQNSNENRDRSNVDYIQEQRENAIKMLIEAGEKYQAGKISKDDFVKVALHASKVASYHRKVENAAKPNPTASPASTSVPSNSASPIPIPSATPTLDPLDASCPVGQFYIHGVGCMTKPSTPTPTASPAAANSTTSSTAKYKCPNGKVFISGLGCMSEASVSGESKAIKCPNGKNYVAGLGCITPTSN